MTHTNSEKEEPLLPIQVPMKNSDHNIPLFIPHLPEVEMIFPYWKEMQENHYYSNNGPLVRKFEEKLSQYFGYEGDNTATFCNGTTALYIGLKALNLPQNSYCLMPAWTFTATPAAAIQAGLIPYFCDVNMDSWTLTPEIAYPLLEKVKNISCVIPVSAFGKPVNSSEWDKFSEQTGISVIIDGAASFDRAQKSRCLQMISLHATKIFGIGEGGLLMSKNETLIQKCRQLANFGFEGTSRNSTIQGTNARQNEFLAAVGLAAFDYYPFLRNSYKSIADEYQHHLPINTPIQSGFGDWISTNLVISLPTASRDKIMQGLKNAGIDSRAWWGDGCHNHEAYKNFPIANLDVTEWLIQRTFSLPFHTYLCQSEIKYISQTLSSLL